MLLCSFVPRLLPIHQSQFSFSQQHLCSASVTLRKLWNLNDTNEMISMRCFNREMEITGYN